MDLSSAVLAGALLAQPPVSAVQETIPATAIPAASVPAPAADAATINYGLGAYAPGDQPYRPLTGEERRRLWVNTTFKNPRNFARSVLFTIPEHTSNSPEQWGQGWDAYSARVGSRMARLTISATLQNGFAAALGHDPRYIACRGNCGVWKRVRNAFIFEFFTFDRNGRRVFNIAGVGGQLASEAIAGTWLPDRSVGGQIRAGMIEQVSFSWMSNLAKEFAPEIKRLAQKVLKKKKP